MDFVLWILGCVLSWSSFLSSIVHMKLQTWRARLDGLLLTSDACGKLADVTLELHAATLNFYLYVEKLAMQNARTAPVWDHNLKYPLNSALYTLKAFSQRLRSRALTNRLTDAGARQIILDAASEQSSKSTGVRHTNITGLSDSSHMVSHGIRDLSDEVQLLGDFPAAAGVLSAIWLGELSDHTRVAVKLFRPALTVDIQQEFLREAHIWSRVMHHENVMPLLGVARLRGSVALISHWMPDGDLNTYLKAHPDANRIELLADVARGLAYVHTRGVVYANVQLSTVLVSSMGRAYLSSFLLAHSQKGEGIAPGNIFNWQFISPEFLGLQGKHYESEERLIATPESDVFAFATLAIEILTDNATTRHYRRLFIRNALEGKFPERPGFLDSRGLTDDLWLLMNACWHREIAQRPTMAEVARRLVQFADAFAPPSYALRPTASPRTLKDISAEIKKLSEHPIAGGGYCDLYLGERLGSEKVALKLVRLFGSTEVDKDAVRGRFLVEARLWAEFCHPRILSFYGICEYGTMSIFMVSPFLKNGNIMHYLSNVDPHANRHRLLSETAEGLLYLHNHSPPVVHGDLKGANILITDEGTAVLADFGLSRISHEATATILQGAGSPRWMAPELILAADDITGPLKTPKSDIYAYGHVILEVLSNKKPFFNLREDLHVIVEILHGRRSPRPDGPVAEKWLDDARWSFSQRCTAIIPEERPDIEVVASGLRRLREGIGSRGQPPDGHAGR